MITADPCAGVPAVALAGRYTKHGTCSPSGVGTRWLAGTIPRPASAAADRVSAVTAPPAASSSSASPGTTGPAKDSATFDESGDQRGSGSGLPVTQPTPGNSTGRP